jgi:hypothetical protein
MIINENLSRKSEKRRKNRLMLKMMYALWGTAFRAHVRVTESVQILLRYEIINLSEHWVSFCVFFPMKTKPSNMISTPLQS